MVWPESEMYLEKGLLSRTQQTISVYRSLSPNSDNYLWIDLQADRVAKIPSSRNRYSEHSIPICNSLQRLSECPSTSIGSSCNPTSSLNQILHVPLLMEYSAMLSLSHQKLSDKAEVTCCLGSPQCSCSDCKMEVAFGGFTILDFPAKSKPAKRLSSSPKIASMGDGHRCKKFPCPICNPGRSQRGGLSSVVVTPQNLLEFYAHGAVQLQAGVLLFGDIMEATLAESSQAQFVTEDALPTLKWKLDARILVPRSSGCR